MINPLRSISSTFCGLAALVAGLVIITNATAAEPGKIAVQVDKPGAAISPTFYGLMTEEINFSYDGGLYGELIQNRIFKNPAGGGRRGGGGGGQAANATTNAVPAAATIPHWSLINSTGAQGEISLDTNDPVNTVALTTSLKLKITSVSSRGRVGMANDGYWGIPVHPNTTYSASFYAKASDRFSGPLTVDIESNDGNTLYASAMVKKITGQWQKYSVTLKTGEIQPAAGRLVISSSSKGTVNFNLVSLFPPTYKDRANGNRVDLMQLLADQKPAFLRFPGGNYVEGNDYANRWDWPRTLGLLEQRPGHMSPWGYRSTDGMGLLEYLEWCEDLNMEPVLAVFAAYTLNRRSYPDEYPRFAQEALDEIEYVTGDVNTKWGAERAKDGHPEPFKLHYVEVGNEDPAGGGRNGQVATYAQRFPIFYLAIKSRYTNLEIISTTRNNFGNYQPDVIDEHYYMSFNAALNNAHMYDNRPREMADGKPVPRIFVGEWATRDNNPTPSFHCALTDAAFLTGLERNADLVVMSCYAPLLVNVSQLNGNGRSMQWATDLIGYNALSAFGSPSYYVQKMFYNNKGDVVLPITVTPQIAANDATNETMAAPPGRGGGGGGRGRGPTTPPQTLYASSSLDQATGDVILKVVNAVESPQQIEISLDGASKIGDQAKMEVLTGGLTDMNSIEEPMKVVPKSSTIDASAKFVREFPGHSVTVLRFSTK